MATISLGRYVPYKSLLHRTDARLKIFGMIILMTAVFMKFSSTAMNFVMYGLIALMILILMAVAHIRLRDLFRQLKAIWFMVLFLLLINLFTFRLPNDTIAFNLGTWAIYWGPLIQTAYIFLRLVLMISITMILTATTRPLDLTYALEWYMYPLKIIRFPVHEVAMTISITLRFIPTLLEETGRIMKAQASRGVDFKQGKLQEKLRAVIALVVPLFISAFQRSADLANAMEARGYDPQGKRTRYRVLHWQIGDTFSLIGILLVLAGVILVKVLPLDFSAQIGYAIQNIGTWIGQIF